MRSFENRPDTTVLDEPLYAHYLVATGLDHPMRDEIVAAGPVEQRDAIASCLAPQDEPVSYQKHMAHHLLLTMDRTWLDAIDHHVLLLRHPARVLASYTRKREGLVTVADLGLPQQVELLQRFGRPLVIDSDDFLLRPEAYLRAMCDRAGLAFDPRMLRWPAGPRESDGVWAPHWYDAVWASTGFAAQVEPLPLPEVGRKAQAVFEEAMSFYEVLAAARLTL
ncbi:MAG: HAD family hydrolase [Actinomycetota bacterium]|nr:HAD family hydrolase [Actinomycetota bacterium]